MAPAGHACFYALAPVAHLGKAPADWGGAFGQRFADAILAEVERRVLPGLRANLVTCFHYTPRDFGRDLSAHLGSAFSLEQIGRAHVGTPVTNAQLVCRLLLEKKKTQTNI